MNPKDRIILALDVPTFEEAEKLVEELKDYVGVYKVGKELFTSVGPKIIEMINSKGGKVFLDLKYHDIPNTVAKAGEAATKLGVFMFNIHCSGGLEMMQQTAEAVSKTAKELNIEKPKLLGVTVLTSISQETLNNELQINKTVEEQVLHLAGLAKQAGLDGIIASPQESKVIREKFKDLIIVTPGVRPSWASTDDQKRITTPGQAIKNGSDFIVIGRPIRKADNRIEAAKKILGEIKDIQEAGK